MWELLAGLGLGFYLRLIGKEMAEQAIKYLIRRLFPRLRFPTFPHISPRKNRMAKTNEQYIEELVPGSRQVFRAFLNEAAREGYQLQINEGLRSNERQAALYAQGRTKPGKIVTNAKPGESLHNQGRAIDVYDKRTVRSDRSIDYNATNWNELGSIAKSLGLKWGGDFPILKDRVHFEYSGPQEVTLEAIPAPSVFKTYPTQEAWWRENYGWIVALLKGDQATDEDVTYGYNQYREKYADQNIENVILTIARDQFKDELSGLGNKFEQVTETLWRKKG